MSAGMCGQRGDSRHHQGDAGEFGSVYSGLKDLFTVANRNPERVLYLSVETSFVDGEFGVDETEHQLEQVSSASRSGRLRDPDRSHGQRYEYH